LREIIDEGKVTWPCWADGPGGPIATAWQVNTIPTIFVLDTEGVIRQKFSGSPGEALDMVIKSLLAEYKPSGELVSIDISDKANRSFTASQGARRQHAGGIAPRRAGIWRS
jgi:hypothetical protein